MSRSKIPPAVPCPGRGWSGVRRARTREPMKPAILAGTGASLSLSTLIGAAALLLLAPTAQADTGVCVGSVNPLDADGCQGGICLVDFDANCHAGGTCLVNVGASECYGTCLANDDAAACSPDATCGVNAHGSWCQQGSLCGIDYDFSKCEQGTCVANTDASWCDGTCLANVDAAACDAGALCGVDAYASECQGSGTCGVNAYFSKCVARCIVDVM